MEDVEKKYNEKSERAEKYLSEFKGEIISFEQYREIDDKVFSVFRSYLIKIDYAIR